MKLKWDEQTQNLYVHVLAMLESDKKCPFQTLGIAKTASMQEIKAAYQDLTLKYHPSQNANATEEDRMKLEWKFEEIAKAYVKLTQPKQQQQTSGHSSQESVEQMQRKLKQMKINAKTAKNAKRSSKNDECSLM